MSTGIQSKSNYLVSIHKWHLLPQCCVLRGFAPGASKKVILDVALLRRQREPLCGLVLGQNLPFLNGHSLP